MNPTIHISPFATPTPPPAPLLVLVQCTDLSIPRYQPLLMTQDLPLKHQRFNPSTGDIRGKSILVSLTIL